MSFSLPCLFGVLFVCPLRVLNYDSRRSAHCSRRRPARTEFARARRQFRAPSELTFVQNTSSSSAAAAAAPTLIGKVLRMPTAGETCDDRPLGPLEIRLCLEADLVCTENSSLDHLFSILFLNTTTRLARKATRCNHWKGQPFCLNRLRFIYGAAYLANRGNEKLKRRPCGDTKCCVLSKYHERSQQTQQHN